MSSLFLKLFRRCSLVATRKKYILEHPILAARGQTRLYSVRTHSRSIYIGRLVKTERIFSRHDASIPDFLGNNCSIQRFVCTYALMLPLLHITHIKKRQLFHFLRLMFKRGKVPYAHARDCAKISPPPRGSPSKRTFRSAGNPFPLRGLHSDPVLLRPALGSAWAWCPFNGHPSSRCPWLPWAASSFLLALGGPTSQAYLLSSVSSPSLSTSSCSPPQKPYFGFVFPRGFQTGCPPLLPCSLFLEASV